MFLYCSARFCLLQRNVLLSQCRVLVYCSAMCFIATQCLFAAAQCFLLHCNLFAVSHFICKYAMFGFHISCIATFFIALQRFWLPGPISCNAMFFIAVQCFVYCSAMCCLLQCNVLFIAAQCFVYCSAMFFSALQTS